MSDRTPRSDLAASSGAYVLNALTTHEEREFEAQLAESEELRNEVTEMTDTAVLLGMAVRPVTPSAELRDSIMSRLASTPQLSREVAPVRTIHAAHRADVAPIEDTTPPTALARKTQARWFQRPLSVAAAAVAAVLVVGGATFGISQALMPTTPGTSVAANQLAAIESASDQQRTVAPVSTGGTATLVYSKSLGKSALLVKNLKSLPSDKVYELWYIGADGKITAAGLLGGTWKVLDGKLRAGDTIGMTVEPSGGSQQPTTKPVVAIASA